MTFLSVVISSEVYYHLSVDSVLTGSPSHYLERQRLYLIPLIGHKILRSQLQATKHITGCPVNAAQTPERKLNVIKYLSSQELGKLFFTQYITA